jgi:hypothetical protein
MLSDLVALQGAALGQDKFEGGHFLHESRNPWSTFRHDGFSRRTVGTERYQGGGVVSTCKTIPLSDGVRSSKINRFQVRRLNLEGKGLVFCPKNCLISRIGEKRTPLLCTKFKQSAARTERDRPAGPARFR